MNGSGGQIVLLAVMLLLPLSALASRQVSPSRMVKMVLAWAAIFAIGLALAAAWQSPWWSGMRAWLPGDDQKVTGGTVRIAMAADGHFYAVALLNGTPRRMLIDSGATVTALSQASVAAAKVERDSLFDTMLETANGQVMATRGSIAMLRLGDIVAHDLPVVMSPAFGDLDVLGMNFLSRLKSWRVEGRTLILEPKRATS